PEDCTGMEDVREAMDTLDREIIHLIGQRSGYVRAAAKFKTGEASVKAPERQKAMLEERRRWAIEEALSPDVVEKMYRDLVSYFIDRELEDWKAGD
ncbi:MAG: isochorismate lyase, partial [Rubrobacteraceae bacterium]